MSHNLDVELSLILCLQDAHRTQRRTMYLVKLLPLGIQNLLLVSVRVSLTPLWQTRSCALLTIRVVSGWALGSSIGCLTAYGTSALESLPLQRHTPSSSWKRLNCLCWNLKSLPSTSCCCALVIHNPSASANSSGVTIVQVLSLPPLNFLTALKTCAVTLSSLDS